MISKLNLYFIRRVFNLRNILNFFYILLIITSLLIVPYHNIRTGFTNWGLIGFRGIKGPINAAALTVQRALTLALIIFYIYNLRLKRKFRVESFEIDLAIKESEDRRHRIEKEYFRLKRQMQNIFDAMDDLVFICSKDYRIEFMNKAIKRIFGGAVGKKCYEILYNREDVCPWCFGKRVFDGEFVTLEHKHEINKRIYRTHSSPLFNPDGSVSKVTVMHDITKEKEIQEEIMSSEQYFRNLFENLSVACFGYDSQANIVTWNKAAEKLYGFKREDVLGHSMFDTIAQKKDYEKTMFYINEVFQGKSFDGLEWQDMNANGTIRYVYTNTYPLYDLQGKISMGISSNIDITQQKAIEHELKTSKEHLEMIMETPQNLIVELDEYGKIKMFNKGCEVVTGYSRSEVLGKDWIEVFIPERLRDTIRTVFEEVKKGTNILPSYYENPILTKSGEERIIFWSHSNFKDENGKIICIIAIGTDITERKKAQQKITEAQEEYRSFLDNVPIHVGMIDESGKFIIWNRYSEQMFGYTKEEVIGKMEPRQLHENDQEAKGVIDKALNEGIFDKELNLIHKDGRKIPSRLVVVPRKIDGKLIGFCGFAEDISNRKKVEAELISIKEKLESIALKDPLTELYNSRYVMERLASEFDRSKRSFSPVSLLLIDIDYFKYINDTYGHEFGDSVLIQVAKLLKSELRTNDVVARWGGEEFMIILPDAGRDNAILVAKKIILIIKSKGFGNERNLVNLKCSIGIVSFPEDPFFTLNEMIEAVEKSIFKVKTAGGDGIGSYIFGLIKDGYKKEVSEKERLLESLKNKLTFFSVKGEESILEAIYSLTKSLELKDHTTRKHSEKTVHYAVKLAQKFGMNEREVDNVRRAAILHDIGKLGLPDEILLKPGPLTKSEFEVVKTHPKIAAEVMSVADFLKDSIPYVLHHHEKYDGTGYPDGLKADGIPLGARIISVVDVYEALTADRPYRKALTKDEAIKIIEKNSGTQFDPNVVTEFINLIMSEKEIE